MQQLKRQRSCRFLSEIARQDLSFSGPVGARLLGSEYIGKTQRRQCRVALARKGQVLGRSQEKYRHVFSPAVALLFT